MAVNSEVDDSVNQDAERFGVRLTSLLDVTGKTQRELAKALHLENDETVNRWATGKRLPRDPRLIVAIARELGCSTDFLLTGRENPGVGFLVGALRELLRSAEELQALGETGVRSQIEAADEAQIAATKAVASGEMSRDARPAPRKRNAADEGGSG